MLAHDTITRTVTDVDGDLLLVAITAEWTGGVREEVYLTRDSEQTSTGRFGTRYTGGSNKRLAVAGPPAGFSYTFLRDGDWPSSLVLIRTTAVDAAGNVTVDETAYSVTLPAASSPGATTATEVITYRALRVDPSTGDLVHNGKNLQLVGGVEAIAQSLRTRLAFFQGEWFLDENFGVPYFQTVLGKSVPLLAVREVFRTIITETVGVLSIKTLELRQTAARQFVLAFTVDTDVGELVSLTVPTGV
jgi:hypothetical protein